MSGSNEDYETVSASFQDIRGRGLGDPLLAVCDGAPGIIEAIETCIPGSESQRCLFHRMSNLAAKVAREDAWPEFREQARAAYQAQSRAIARDLPADLVRKWETELSSAVACFQDDFEACIAHLRMPVQAPQGDPDHQPAGAPVRRGAPPHEGDSQRLGERPCSSCVLRR